MPVRYKILIISAVLFFAGWRANTQGIRDSVFQISGIEVRARQIFKKEIAGMKETRVDSLVLAEKINLNLSDVLAENTSVLIKDYGRGALSTASFRGTAPTHTQVSWNGININSPMLGMVDFSLIPVYIIDNISLQHGAASISGQSGGLGGLISIENTAGWDNGAGGRLYQGIGSYSTYDLFGQFHLGNNKIRSKTRLYYNVSDNDYSYINKHIFERDSATGEMQHPAEKNNNAGYNKYGITQEVYYRISPGWIASARLWYQDAKRTIPTVLSYEGSDTIRKENRQNDQTLKSVLEAKYYGEKVSIRMRSGLDYQQLDYVMRIHISGYEEQKPVNSGSDMFSLYNRYEMDYRFNENISLTLHADHGYFDISTLDSSNHAGYDVTRNEFSLYGGAFIKMSEKINISLGLRKDRVPDIFSPAVYNIGCSYKPFTGHAFILKSNISRNFHHPTLNDLYWQPGGNPDLLPEEGYTFETGLHYLLQRGQTDLETQLTGYYSDINNWILWLPGFRGYWEPLNIKKVRSYGLEYQLKLGWKIKKTRIGLNGNYALTRSRNYGELLVEGDGSYGKQLPFIPVHSGNAFISVSNSGYYLNIHHSSYGVRYLLNSNREGFDDDSGFFGASDGNHPMVRLYPYHINHLSFGKTFEGKIFNTGVEFKIYNLFNESYRNSLNRFMPGRNYMIMVRMDF